jgi:hypothetical protein
VEANASRKTTPAVGAAPSFRGKPQLERPETGLEPPLWSVIRPFVPDP